MGFHHVAIATTDMAVTHRFYTEVMGFELVKGVAGPTDAPGGWSKHLFYDTGGDGMIAFWELHDERMESFDPAISTGLGLAPWVNHLAFTASSLDDLADKRRRWLDGGHDVMQIDHGFCVSAYTMDPNGILVEWCVDTAPYTAADKADALALLTNDSPGLADAPRPQFFEAREPAEGTDVDDLTPAPNLT